MDVNIIIQLINGVGFPIAACIGMGAFIVWDKKCRREEGEKRQKEQAEMLSKLSDAVTNNTIIVQKLVDRFERGETNDGV